MLKELPVPAAQELHLQKTDQNVNYTTDFIRDTYKIRLYKPARPLSIGLEEEERRSLQGWRGFDEALRLARLDPVGHLEDFVVFV